MGTVVVVVAAPVGDDDLGFEEAGELLDGEAFVAQLCHDGRARYVDQLPVVAAVVCHVCSLAGEVSGSECDDVDHDERKHRDTGR